MLPFARRVKDKARKDTDCIAIDTGILSELYSYGITKEQLSNLKALADYMSTKYRKSDGKMIIEITNKQLRMYLGEEEDERVQGTEGIEGVPVYKEQP